MSAKGKSPAFQFYAAEWLADENVRLMTLEETGAYIDALAICWREGSIPACPEMLARLIGKGCSTDVATVVQRLFNIRYTDERFSVERLKHKRLEIEREKQRVRSEQTSKAGKKSAQSKRETITKPRENGDFNIRSTSVQHPYNPSSSSLDEDGRSAQVGAAAVAEEGDPSGVSTGKPKRNQAQRATGAFVEPVIPAQLSTPVFLKAWSEWKQHRREIKHPLKSLQAQKQIDEFTTWGEARSVAAINYTIMKGWQGIAEEDASRSTSPSKGPQQPVKQRMPTYEESVERGYNSQTGLGPKL